MLSGKEMIERLKVIRDQLTWAPEVSCEDFIDEPHAEIKLAVMTGQLDAATQSAYRMLCQLMTDIKQEMDAEEGADNDQ